MYRITETLEGATKMKFCEKFLDGTPVPKKYKEALAMLIKDTLDAEEIFTLDELERKGQRHEIL